MRSTADRSETHCHPLRRLPMGPWLAVSVLAAGIWSSDVAAQPTAPGGANGVPVGGGADRVAVIPLDIVGDVPAGRPALEAAVLRGLTIASAPTLEPGEAEARLKAGPARLPCDNAECWSALGRTLDARYLVTGTVERKGTLFAVEFRLIDARPGRVLATESNGCDADDCSVAELCRLTVRELARQTLGQASENPAPPVALPPVVALESPPRPAPIAARVADHGSADQPEGDRSSRKKWATAAIVAGIVAAGAGGVLFYYHGRCAERHSADRTVCLSNYDSRIRGIAAAGVGAALVTTGVVLHLTGRQRETSVSGTQVSVGWGRLFLSGRF